MPRAKARNETPRWITKAQRGGALVIGAAPGKTLNEALLAQPVERLPLGVSEELLVTGSVWIDDEVCREGNRILDAGNFIVVYPHFRTYTHDEQGWFWSGFPGFASRITGGGTWDPKMVIVMPGTDVIFVVGQFPVGNGVEQYRPLPL
jgi:hypothetical protein